MNYSSEIEKSLEILNSGKILLYPTDTIWGLGCDATNSDAIEKIYQIKQRVLSKSLIVLADSIEMLLLYTKQIPAAALKLIDETQKPLTIIYQDAINLAKNAIAEDGSIAIRIPNDKFCKELIKRFGKPIISTSANISGEEAPNNFNEVSEIIKNSVDYIVNWKQNETEKSKASTIVLIDKNNNINYIRK